MNQFKFEFKAARQLVQKFLKQLKQEEEKLSKKEASATAEEDELFRDVFSAEKLKEKRAFHQNIATEKAYKRVQHKLKRDKKSVFAFKTLAMAAVLLAVIGVSGWFFFLKPSGFPINEDGGVAVDLDAGSEKAVLVLDNGEKISLGDSEMIVMESDSSIVNRNNQLIYSQNSGSSLGYNELQVPSGGIYSLVLSDGTRVWLNSESSLRYPVNFSGENRSVVLSGEAYFEVAENKEKPFIVNHQNFKVRVLGTVFNINAYKETQENTISLISGKVQLTNVSGTPIIKDAIALNPGEQALLDLKENTLQVEEANVASTAAWMQGRFYFKNEHLGKILEQMERWYGFRTKFKEENKANIRFTGVIKKDKSLREILDIISKTSNIKYQIIKTENKYEVIII